ncbi:MAG: tetratricopeptide repeat protein [Actinomycetota bacterium]
MADQKHSVQPANEEEQAEVAQERIEQLETRIKQLPNGRPFERGVLRFNLGVAYAEAPTGDRPSNLSRALASLESATRLFDSTLKPLEHARAQNVLGIVLKELRRYAEAAAAFTKAADMVPMQVNPGEYGAHVNNLGLTLVDLGRREEAIDAYTKALQAFSGPEFLRQRIDVIHNIGQAHAGSSDAEEIKKGIEFYAEGLELTDPQEFPYQWALLNNSLGVAYTAVGQPEKAAESFSHALRVYSRARWPFQYALAKNNVGLANIQIGDTMSLRRAVASCEEAIMVLDVRMHREQWEQVFKNLELAEKGLKELGQQGTRSEHFARLLGEEDDQAMVQRLRERLADYTTLPDPRRVEALAELDLAMLDLPDEQASRLTNSWLSILMELPHEQFLAGLQARMIAHGTLGDEARDRAGRLLDNTIQNELLAPQRIRVRDTLYSIGYERPGSTDQNGTMGV